MGEFDDLIKAVADSKTATEAMIAEFREKKEKETADLLPGLEKSFQDSLEKMRQDAVAEAKAYIDEQNAAAAPGIKTGESEPEYKSLGHWLAKTARGEIERKDFGEATGGVGGYMVPDQFVSQILSIPMEQGIVRTHGATVLPLMSDTARVPALNPTSHATNFFGGMLGYWLDEANTITATAWTAKEVELNIASLAAAGKISKQLLNDSPLGMSGVIERQFGEVITFMEDQAFFDGDGTGKPQGIIGSGCEVVVNRAGGASTVTTADVLSMLSKFLGNEARAVWCANRDCLPQLYALKDGNNNALFVQNMGPSGPATLMGLPLIWTEKCSALGTKGDLCLADWGYYVIGDRQQVVVDWSDHVEFLKIQSVVRLYERIDGKPWMDATYTPRKGTAKSPFVILN